MQLSPGCKGNTFFHLHQIFPQLFLFLVKKVDHLHKPVSIIEENGKKPLSLAETTSLMLWLCPLLVSQLTDKVLIHPINSYGITNPRKEKPRYR